jgi:hypothetical protein
MYNTSVGPHKVLFRGGGFNLSTKEEGTLKSHLIDLKFRMT